MTKRTRAFNALTNVYSRAARQWVESGGKRFFARSSWEANYGHYLEYLKNRGDILDWEHEAHTFWFDGIKRGVMSYLPDFKVTMPDGTIEWHEIKGWMDKKSKTKMKRMAKYHPKETVCVYGEDWFKMANRTFPGVVPGWTAPKKNKPKENAQD